MCFSRFQVVVFCWFKFVHHLFWVVSNEDPFRFKVSHLSSNLPSIAGSPTLVKPSVRWGWVWVKWGFWTNSFAHFVGYFACWFLHFVGTFSIETEGTTSQSLGNDVMGALMAQMEALCREMKSGNDAIRSDMDSMRGDMIRIRARVNRLCPPKSS